MKKIIQMLPADKWSAVFKQDDGTELKESLVCFVLVERDGETAVEGLCGGEYIDFCDSATNFIRYVKD